MQQWLIKQKAIDSTNYYSVSLLTAQVNWSSAHAVLSDSGSTYYIASLTSSGQIFADATTMLNRYLVLQQYKDSIVNSNIIEVLGNKSDIVKMADALITGYNKNQISSFNGTVSILTWNNAYKESKVFTNGLLHIRKILVAKGKQKPVVQSTGGSKILNDFTDWYWDTYIDGNLVDEEYLYTTCDNDCQSDAIYDITGAMKIKLNCGGGGGSDDPPPCDAPATDFGDGDDLNVTDGDATNDPTYRNKNYVWTYLTLNSQGLSWQSLESGQHHYDGAQWGWVSLTHVGTNPVGMAGGSTTYSANPMSSTPNIISTTQASMTIAYVISVSTTCNGSTVTTNFPISQKTKTFTITN